MWAIILIAFLTSICGIAFGISLSSMSESVNFISMTMLAITQVANTLSGSFW
jgi:hypothetical protein